MVSVGRDVCVPVLDWHSYVQGCWKRNLTWREFGGGYRQLRTTNTLVCIEPESSADRRATSLVIARSLYGMALAVLRLAHSLHGTLAFAGARAFLLWALFYGALTLLGCSQLPYIDMERPSLSLQPSDLVSAYVMRCTRGVGGDMQMEWTVADIHTCSGRFMSLPQLAILEFMLGGCAIVVTCASPVPIRARLRRLGGMAHSGE
ncbi:MAG: hypothetical protein SGPRY_009189 [Prymnesium sp.]